MTAACQNSWRCSSMITDLKALNSKSYFFRQRLVITITSQNMTELTFCNRAICFARLVLSWQYCIYIHVCNLLSSNCSQMIPSLKTAKVSCLQYIAKRLHHGHAYSYQLPASSFTSYIASCYMITINTCTSGSASCQLVILFNYCCLE